MPDIVISFPEELKPLADAVRAMVSRVTALNRTSGDGSALDYAPLEQEMGDLAGGIERAAHEVMLQRLDIDAPRVLVGSAVFARGQRCRGPYYTKAGEVSVMRSLYREVGVRNGKTVDAVSLRVGVIGDGWLPGTAQAMAFEVQQGTSREAAASAAEVGRLRYSRSAFEDVAHLVGEAYAPRREDIEDALIRAYDIPQETASVSAAIDRVSLPMEEPRARPVGRPRKDAPKNPIARNFRMAWCGTVTLHDADGKEIHTIRYGMMPHGKATDLVDALAADVAVLLEKRPNLAVAALADGAHELWNLLEAGLNEDTLGLRVHSLVDLWHLLEKLGKAARLIHGEDKADAVVKRWRLALLNQSDAVRDIIRELWKGGKRKVRVGDTRPTYDAIRYMLNHRARMDYASARRAGLPVGSGNVEATCKSLVETRMKRAGSRWKETTGGHVLQLRALALSNRWSPAMAHTLAPLRKGVRKAS